MQRFPGRHLAEPSGHEFIRHADPPPASEPIRCAQAPSKRLNLLEEKLGAWELQREAALARDEQPRRRVASVSRSLEHGVGKRVADSIELLAGLGVKGDAHLGETVKHRSRVARDPTQPNLRQVHLIHEELLDALGREGFEIVPGQMGENITTRGIGILELPAGTRLHIGSEAVVEITGLRNPCAQLEGIASGLMSAVLDWSEDGALVRKAGVMGVVIEGGEVRAGDEVRVAVPSRPHRPLGPV